MFYINKFNQKFGRSFGEISADAKEILMSGPWKGNVRELRNAIERVMLAENTKVLEARHLSFLQPTVSRLPNSGINGFPGRLPDEGIHLDSVIKDFICQAMERCGGSKAKAARLLGISKPTLVYRLEKYGLDEWHRRQE
jgi:DNA-binding NtrC family response regulator